MVLASFTVLEQVGDVRLSDFLIGKFQEILTRKGIKKAIVANRIRVNGVVATTSYWVQHQDVIELLDATPKVTHEFDFPLEIIHEDDYLAVILKPAGIPVSGNYFKTIVNALPQTLTRSKQVDRLPTFLPVHRLDAATSGLLLIAKTHAVRVKLGEMLEHRNQIQKTYLAILQGELKTGGSVTFPIDEKEAISTIEILENIDTLKDTQLTLVKLSPITGRTHQLRIHTSKLGFPIVGDKLYAEDVAMKRDKGLFLVAVGLAFTHPVTAEVLNIEIPMPLKFSSYIAREKRRKAKYD